MSETSFGLIQIGLHTGVVIALSAMLTRLVLAVRRNATAIASCGIAWGTVLVAPLGYLALGALHPGRDTTGSLLLTTLFGGIVGGSPIEPVSLIATLLFPLFLPAALIASLAVLVASRTSTHLPRVETSPQST